MFGPFMANLVTSAVPLSRFPAAASALARLNRTLDVVFLVFVAEPERSDRGSCLPLHACFSK